MDWLHLREYPTGYKEKRRRTFANTYSAMHPLLLVKIFGGITPSTSSPTLNELSPGSATTPENSISGTATTTMRISHTTYAVIHLVAASEQQALEAWACTWQSLSKRHAAKEDNLHLIESHSFDMDKNVITSRGRPEYIDLCNMQNIKWQTPRTLLPSSLT